MSDEASSKALSGAGGDQVEDAAQVDPSGERVGLGLRGRLLLLTTIFVLFAELLIFPPSAANYRERWLDQQVQAGEIAALAMEASPDGEISAELSASLMEKTGMELLAVVTDARREMIFAPNKALSSDIVVVDRSKPRMLIGKVWATFGHMFAPSDRYILLIDKPLMDRLATGESQVSRIEAILPEAPLKKALLVYCRNIVFLSLLISALTGGLIYLVMYRLLVRPMLRITGAVHRFAQAPEKAAPFSPSGRQDEIGQAENALLVMQETVSAAFRQKTRLAALGEAVAKINHDLRNSLSVAQLVSETVSRSKDPRVKEATPRLERALTRAIDLAESTLRYGRVESRPPRMQDMPIREAAEEAVREGLAAAPEVDWLNEIDDDFRASVDPDHLHRIIANLSRNAGQAIVQHGAEDDAGLITLRAMDDGEFKIIQVIDNGPGVPEKIRARLFQPFSASGSRDGTGLGLAIARELAVAMGGDITLQEHSGPGAVFELRIKA